MKKRLVAIFMIVIMLCVTGCGDTQETSSRNNSRESIKTERGEEIIDENAGGSESSLVNSEPNAQVKDDNDISEPDSETENVSEVSTETNTMQIYSVQVYGDWSLGQKTEKNIESMVTYFMDSINRAASMIGIFTPPTKGELRDNLLNREAGNSIVSDYDIEQFGGLTYLCGVVDGFMGKAAVTHYKTTSTWSYGCSSVNVTDANIDYNGFSYFEGTDAVIGMFVEYTMDCKLDVYGTDSSAYKDLKDSLTAYLAVTLVNDPENPTQWKINGIYPVVEESGTYRQSTGMNSQYIPTYKFSSYHNIEIDAPEELLETCFDFDNKLVSETVSQAQQEIAESSDDDFQAAMDAYSQRFTDTWGAMFALPDISIPFYLVVEDYENYSWVNIYHYEGGQIVTAYENYYFGEPWVQVYYNDNIVCVEYRNSYEWQYKYFECTNGFLQEIDEETFKEIRNGDYHYDKQIELNNYADTVADYMLNR